MIALMATRTVCVAGSRLVSAVARRVDAAVVIDIVVAGVEEVGDSHGSWERKGMGLCSWALVFRFLLLCLFLFCERLGWQRPSLPELLPLSLVPARPPSVCCCLGTNCDRGSFVLWRCIVGPRIRSE